SDHIVPAVPKVALAVAVGIDRVLAVARRDELGRSHRTGVGAERFQGIDVLLPREQQELHELSPEEGGARRIIERECRERIDDAVASGDTAERCFYAQDADDGCRETLIADGFEPLAVCKREIRALMDAYLGQESCAILVPRDDAFGGAADRIEDRLLRFRLLEEGFDFAPVESMRALHLVDESPHLGTSDVECECRET